MYKYGCVFDTYFTFSYDMLYKKLKLINVLDIFFYKNNVQKGKKKKYYYKKQIDFYLSHFRLRK